MRLLLLFLALFLTSAHAHYSFPFYALFALSGPGDNCRYSWCRSRLVCQDDICKTPLNGECTYPHAICQDGLVCAGSRYYKICVTPKSVGESCDVYPFSVCSPDLRCVNNVCTRPQVRAGESCLFEDAVCAEGLSCMGNSERKICARPRAPGSRCSENDFIRCEEGLQCAGGRCRTPVDGNCSSQSSLCVEGSVCAGESDKEKCVVPRKPTESCETSPTEVCEQGLICIQNTCFEQVVPAGGNCLPAGSTCDVDLSCAGNSDRKICVRPRGPGQKCNDNPFVLCGVGMICQDGVCKSQEKQFCEAKNSICVRGTTCVATPIGKTCFKARTLGERCSSSVFSMCIDGLLCESGKCAAPKIKAGESCKHEGAVCEDGLVCAGNSIKKICVRPVQPGRRCIYDKFVRCTEGHVCDRYICRTLLNGNCRGKYSVCVTGTVCAGNNSEKRCVKPMSEGNPCGSDPLQVCDKGLECIGNVCTQPIVPMSGDCLPKGSVCGKGLVCRGTRNKRVCVEPRAQGKRCFNNPFSACLPGLSCEQGVCKTPVGGSCLPSGSICERAAECAGTSTDKTCVLPKSQGETCGLTSKDICKRSLSCTDNVCSVSKIPAGGVCLFNRATCDDGLICAGNAHRKICVTPKERGDQCGRSSFEKCQSDLECHGGRCCVPQNGDCLPSRSICVPGLVCAGRTNKKRCVEPMPEGDACGQDPFWVCEKGLNCVNNICVKPGIQDGGSCAKNEDGCSEGLVCVGTKSRKFCVSPLNSGSACYLSPFVVCKDGFVCDGEMCGIPRGKDCTENSTLCADGLVCAGTSSKKCVVPIDIGGECNASPMKVCRSMLNCVRNKCERAKIPEGATCTLSGAKCVDGLVCAGNSKQRLCVRPRTPGESCGQNKFSVCTSNLVCYQKRCKVPKFGDCRAFSSECMSGTECVGTRFVRKCVKSMEKGQPCALDPFWVCSKSLKCIRGTCFST